MDDDDFDADQGQGYDEAQADPMLADTKDGGDFNRRDCVLFVIDARRAMFANKCGDVAFAHVALACAADCMAERVVSADSDLVGVLLVGTARSANDFGFERAAVLCPLAEPRAVQIRELRNIIWPMRSVPSELQAHASDRRRKSAYSNTRLQNLDIVGAFSAGRALP
jgi:hypothetical protein